MLIVMVVMGFTGLATLLKRLHELRARCSGVVYCHRCFFYAEDFDRVHWHFTPYADGSYCFFLCEHCWEALGTPENRLPYYQNAMEVYNWSPEKRPLVEKAVLEGK
jgi:hypothetical protein